MSPIEFPGKPGSGLTAISVSRLPKLEAVLVDGGLVDLLYSTDYGPHSFSLAAQYLAKGHLCVCPSVLARLKRWSLPVSASKWAKQIHRMLLRDTKLLPVWDEDSRQVEMILEAYEPPNVRNDFRYFQVGGLIAFSKHYKLPVTTVDSLLDDWIPEGSRLRAVCLDPQPTLFARGDAI